MKDRDALVDALGRELRRASDAEDPRWDQLAKGELSPDAIDALLDASPLDSAREEGLLDRTLAPRLVPIRRGPRPTWLALALAAALGGPFATVVFTRPSPPPEYTLAATGDASTRGPDAEPIALVVSTGTRVHLTLTPSSSRAEDIVARLFLVSGAEVRALPVRPPPGPAIEIEGSREELFPEALAGSYVLVVLITRAGTATDDTALAAMARDPAHAAPGRRAIRRSIELRGGPIAVPREVE